MNDYKFGNFLRMLREKNGMTQADLSNKLGVTPAAVSKWENGSSKPRVEILFQLAHLLGVRAEELMSGQYIADETLDPEAVTQINEQYSHGRKLPEGMTMQNRKIAKKVLLIAGTCLLGLVALASVLRFSIKIPVPDVAGKSLLEASELLREHTFQTEVNTAYHDTAPRDMIIAQSEEAGKKLGIGSTITLTVSNGVEHFPVPDLKKMTAEEARTKLEVLKFTVKTTEAFSDKYEKGTVISQNQAAGNMLPKGSEIQLVISKGPDLVQVPDITGKTPDEIQAEIKKAGLKFKTDIQCSDSVAEGSVISMNVKSGDMVSRNATVVAYISAGVANTVGNAPSNSCMWGRVATQGNWVYYTNSVYNYYLYKMRQDGSEKQILVKEPVLGINVVGEWIYYTSIDRQNGGLYKIRLDGTQKTTLASELNYFVHVADGWIYTQDIFGDRKVYRRKTDGTGKTLVCGDSCNNVHIVGDWIYYTTTSNDTAYKIRTDGTEKGKLHSGFSAYHLVADNNAVVGVELKEYLKINADGSGFLSYNIGNTQMSFLNANDGWIYFLENDFSAGQSAYYKMRYDRTEKTKILDVNFKNSSNYFIHVADGWLYFPNEDDNCYLYRVKTDGTNLQKVYS